MDLTKLWKSTPKKPHFEHLKNKWSKQSRDLQEKILKEHKSTFDWFFNNSKQIALSSLVGFFLFTTPILLKHVPNAVATEKIKEVDKSVFLVSDLYQLLPKEFRFLTTDEEKQIGEILSRNFKMKLSPELNGIRLNTVYGKIGQEQHLARFPGDTMATHFQNEEDAQKYWSYGMAPGLGAWGYFKDPTSDLKEKDTLREKYYIAVQTFLAPGFNNNPKEYVDFFKFRKMLVVNPQNGKAMVVVVGDAGPAKWTGKHLGGSPEVMRYLERVDGKQVGTVLYYFIDDPNDEVKLGPIDYN